MPAFSPIRGRSFVSALTGGKDALHALTAVLSESYAPSVALVDSGTTALALAITAARARVGSANACVALPAYTCYSVATAAVQAGGEFCFYDIDAATLGPDMDSLDECFAAGAGVVVVTTLFGQPVDWDAIGARARFWNATTIDDAAQGHGLRWRGRVAGTCGDFGVLSFGRGKGWTGGGGGAVLVSVGHADSIAAPAPAPLGDGVRAMLRLAAQWTLGRPALYPIPALLPWLRLGETAYQEPWPPRAMSAAVAAAVLANREASDAALEHRRAIAAIYDAHFRGTRYATGAAWPHARHGYLRFPLLVTSRSMQDLGATRRLGIERGYPLPLPQLPALKALQRTGSTRWDGAVRLADELVTLPTHRWVARAEALRSVRFITDVAPADTAPSPSDLAVSPC